MVLLQQNTWAAFAQKTWAYSNFSVFSRAIGIGFLAPLRAPIEAVRIIVRIVLDYSMDTDGTFYVWFGAFVYRPFGMRPPPYAI